MYCVTRMVILGNRCHASVPYSPNGSVSVVTILKKTLNLAWNEINVNHAGAYIWNEGRNFF